MAETTPYALHWFRRDLRIAGNPALQHSRKEFEGRVVGVFCFDKKFLARPDFSANRFQFFLETLKVLRDELRRMGSDLIFLDVGPDDAMPQLLARLKVASSPMPSLVSWNRDYEPFAVERDARLKGLFDRKGIRTHTERDHLLIEPHEIVKASDPKAPFQVFTPFSRNWLEVFDTNLVQERIEGQKSGKSSHRFKLTWIDLLGKEARPDGAFESYFRGNAKKVTVPLPPAGSLAALARLRTFEKRIEQYADARDIPAVDGTSRLSIYFKNGSLTVAQAIAHLGLQSYGKKDKSPSAKFFSELIWREFYYYILAKFPFVERESFNPKFRAIEWENREDYFEAWKAGMTGYPIVDAGMRQLKATGWMHNRVRMIVASFLTKDLHIDWRWGEKYFMEQLLDGDLAPNNGGWQWAASTGCDPQPYFRIFNPVLQSRKFDPKGLYLRKFVPELARLSDSDLHDPPPQERGDYPQPIVDHGERRLLALEMYAAKP